MKSTLILAIFAALSAAAPQNAVSILSKRTSDLEYAAKSNGIRCGGPEKVKCRSTDEICASENKFRDDPMGICIKKPKSFCGGPRKLTDGCSKEKGYFCVADASVRCVADANYCGYCIQQKWVDQFGGLRSSGTNRCGGPSGKKCFEAIGEFCVGEEVLNDKMGICTTFNRACTVGKPEECGTNPLQGPMYCVKDTRSECPSWQEPCPGGICLEGRYVAEVGLRKSVPVYPPTKATKSPLPASSRPPKKTTTKTEPPKPTLPPVDETEGEQVGYGGGGGGGASGGY